jgi:hypothetical protein
MSHSLTCRKGRVPCCSCEGVQHIAQELALAGHGSHHMVLQAGAPVAQGRQYMYGVCSRAGQGRGMERYSRCSIAPPPPRTTIPGDRDMCDTAAPACQTFSDRSEVV